VCFGDANDGDVEKKIMMRNDGMNDEDNHDAV
jgi:hypothetical protein